MTLKNLLSPALPLALIVVGCSAADSEPDAPEPAETANTVEADGGIGNGAPPPETPKVAKAIPQQFLGAWDTADGNCSPVTETRMEIGSQSVGFYESHGEVTRVDIANPNSIIVSLAMEGEGEKWQMERKLALSDAGDSLSVSADKTEEFDPIQLKKCLS